MSCNLNSLKGTIYRIIYGNIIGVIEGDTRSLDIGPYSICLREAIQGSSEALVLIQGLLANRMKAWGPD